MLSETTDKIAGESLQKTIDIERSFVHDIIYKSAQTVSSVPGILGLASMITSGGLTTYTQLAYVGITFGLEFVTYGSNKVFESNLYEQTFNEVVSSELVGENLKAPYPRKDLNEISEVTTISNGLRIFIGNGVELELEFEEFDIEEYERMVEAHHQSQIVKQRLQDNLLIKNSILVMNELRQKLVFPNDKQYKQISDYGNILFQEDVIRSLSPDVSDSASNVFVDMKNFVPNKRIAESLNWFFSRMFSPVIKSTKITESKKLWENISEFIQLFWDPASQYNVLQDESVNLGNIFWTFIQIQVDVNRTLFFTFVLFHQL